MKFEKPKLIYLSGHKFTDGALCNPGSSADVACTSGVVASGGGSGCATGPTGAPCSTGTGAIGRCGSGNSPTRNCSNGTSVVG